MKSDFVFHQIRDWIRQCEQYHGRCPKQPTTAPHRLLDVGDPERPLEQRTIRLVQGVQERVKYIALSHCWGVEQNFSTTTLSLERRIKSISWDDLPKTYQDTIFVARKLEVRYVWIDSLCILQDSA